jgi:hypothetical protein
VRKATEEGAPSRAGAADVYMRVHHAVRAIDERCDLFLRDA